MNARTPFALNLAKGMQKCRSIFLSFDVIFFKVVYIFIFRKEEKRFPKPKKKVL